MRFVGTCYRAHNPHWAFAPTSGQGAALHGGRFNPKGVPTLYLALNLITAVKEANQGFAHKIEPCVLCCYDVDCDDVIDLRTDESRKPRGVALADMSCAWFALAKAGEAPPSWRVAERFMAEGRAGLLVPSFAASAQPGDGNLVLWSWSDEPPHQARVFDPGGRLRNPSPGG